MLRSHIIICSVVTIMHVPDALTSNKLTYFLEDLTGQDELRPERLIHLPGRSNVHLLTLIFATLLPFLILCIRM